MDRTGAQELQGREAQERRRVQDRRFGSAQPKVAARSIFVLVAIDLSGTKIGQGVKQGLIWYEACRVAAIDFRRAGTDGERLEARGGVRSLQVM